MGIEGGGSGGVFAYHISLPLPCLHTYFAVFSCNVSWTHGVVSEYNCNQSGFVRTGKVDIVYTGEKTRRRASLTIFLLLLHIRVLVPHVRKKKGKETPHSLRSYYPFFKLEKLFEAEF